jgi:hypothetical protein
MPRRFRVQQGVWYYCDSSCRCYRPPSVYRPFPLTPNSIPHLPNEHYLSLRTREEFFLFSSSHLFLYNSTDTIQLTMPPAYTEDADSSQATKNSTSGDSAKPLTNEDVAERIEFLFYKDEDEELDTCIAEVLTIICDYNTPLSGQVTLAAMTNLGRTPITKSHTSAKGLALLFYPTMLGAQPCIQSFRSFLNRHVAPRHSSTTSKQMPMPSSTPMTAAPTTVTPDTTLTSTGRRLTSPTNGSSSD